MLVNETELLDHAEKNKYAVPGFFPFNFEFIKIIIEVAEEEKAPIAICQGPEFIESFGDKVFTNALITAVENTKIPMTLSIDHTFVTDKKTVSRYEKALKLGWKSAMLDGSLLSFEENVELTKEMTKLCQKFGAQSVGALGEVRRFFPQAMNYESEFDSTFVVEEHMMTNPDRVEEFVQKTAIDSLAISIGQYVRSLWDGERPPFKKTGRLDFERLTRIRDKTNAHLILHGSSHVVEKDLQTAAENGVSMIKVASEQALIWSHTLREFLEKDKDTMFPEDIQKTALQAVKESMRYYIRLFKANNQI